MHQDSKIVCRQDGNPDAPTNILLFRYLYYIEKSLYH